MHNIVILGDIRLHLLVCPKGINSFQDIVGGAALMQSAVQQCFSRLSATPQSDIYSYDFDEAEYVETLDSNLEGVYRWFVESRHMRGTNHKRYCLCNLEPKGLVYLPPPSKSLIDAISSGNGFPNGSSLVPDIIVFDDLGLGAGELSFPKVRILGEEFKARVEHAIQERDQLKDELDSEQCAFEAARIAGENGELRQDERKRKLRSLQQSLIDKSNETLELTLQRLFTLLREKADSVGGTGYSFPAEPVMVLSTAGSIPVLPQSGELLTDLLSSPSDDERQNIWQQTYKCEALRRRTIVIFDAETVRKEISVSAGLSWERTAQETIAEFKRCHELRGFLDFGVVVVRFGITGLLTIVNEGNGKWSHTLYFNPDQDDATWSQRSEGEVLGTTSILVATISEELHKVCRYRDGHPILQDIKVALDRALLVFLNRILNHIEWGFGATKNQFHDELEGAFSFSFPSRSEIMRRNLASSEDLENGPKLSATLIQKIQFSPFRSQYWSILNQSCQADINDVAQNIVLFGPNLTLNTMEDSAEVFAELWLEETLEFMRHESNSDLSVFDLKKNIDLFRQCLVKKLGTLLGGRKNALRNVIGLRPFSALETLRSKIEEEYRVELEKEIEKAFGAVVDEILANVGKDIPSGTETGPKDWDEVCQNSSDWEPYRDEWDARLKSRVLSLLVDICKRSTDMQVWSNPISSPVLWLGRAPEPGAPDKRMLVIDRKEVEGIRAVKRMIEQYLSDVKEGKADRPLSIAVFGPPGAGKSVAVNKIIEMVGGTDSEPQVINLSNLTGFESFERRLQEIVLAKSGIPVIFFDEFDSSLAGKPHGWLKSFLSVMEDGKPLREAIYIFAGGTADTFESFSMTERTRSDEKWAEFCLQKGPDFISRLKGHINVVGVNPANPEDDLYLVRRALALRFLLSQAQGLKEGDKVQIDQNMLNAFLHVPRYVHGSRSMRMLVDLCVKRDGKVVAMSEVPPIHQLDMQVDGKAFSLLASGQTSPELRHSESP